MSLASSPFVDLFTAFFRELRTRAYAAQSIKSVLVTRFLDNNERAILAVVEASEALDEVMTPDEISQASKVTALVERMDIPNERRIAILATALSVVADPDFEETFRRIQEERKQKP